MEKNSAPHVKSQAQNNDQVMWDRYHATKDMTIRNQLVKQFDGLIQGQVNKWAGPVPRDVLYGEARVMVAKAMDTYDPSVGTLLSTHVTNSLAPLSRIVYTHQNTVRIPENLTLKLNSYHGVMDTLTTELGRTPTTDEIHSHTGWTAKDINKFSRYVGKDLVESSGSGDEFFTGEEDADEDALFSIYMSLAPEEKRLFEMLTGYNHKPKLATPEILKELGITQSQLSYRRTLLNNSIARLTGGRKKRKK
jgi:DNA-directed RNA polymerase specialized sigma subunit